MSLRNSSFLSGAMSAAMIAGGAAAIATTPATESKPGMVRVHGGFVDGSGPLGVYKKTLRKDGDDVAIVQNTTISSADDVAVTRRAIAAQPGPVVLVGHSHGRCRDHGCECAGPGRRLGDIAAIASSS